MTLRAAVLLAPLALGACMPPSHRVARRLEGRYSVPPPGPGWRIVEPGGADHAWYNPDLGASMYTDSNCGPRYFESRTEDLATQLTAGLRDLSTSRDEVRALGGREGVLRVHTGKLDGVVVTVGLGVVNRGACTYDLALIAPPGTFDQGWPAYERLLDGFAPR